MKLSELLRKGRLDVGLTIMQASEAAGVAHNTLWRAESGKSPKAGWDTVVRLMRAYNIPLTTLGHLELP